ncbi:hypothetical protein LEP1GSC103_3715 [Leptospira borgpetersenii serovar Javanica str. UI 09931]|uniref:Uncharacterized protein n=5 Tax=Leptospira borgpetersenii TaxID=174 RepID=M3FD85_LEPBO|nr:hypothetical protein LBBP_00900 [Leptospira borgpetersenii serovar Ballum]EKP13671.1 hypothetical protein LEP1GSC128_2618 [Leptospira borgpetersenii str. 200801926]EKQ93218.1 hypothetical protein LEP1GSC101_3852 [Leptospira borgpetersenii str. UI 09149]EKQ98286.1 hypothetical protein LEP1GSC121_3374 [Leptospira borgpetersenii serovar Castellonis str. 200801910]EMF99822.1 hypothetical protein LEP1GSC123_3590 [Leptospira borgpetersenii str. 200701203]EMK09948.1 hypothetical protein LEP1GSC066
MRIRLEHPDKSLPFLKMGAFIFTQSDIKNVSKLKSKSVPLSW